MNRGHWIAVILLAFLVFLAVAIGIILWMRRRSVLVVETGPNANGNNNAVVAPIVTGSTKRVNNVKQVKRPASTGATYREILGKRSSA